MGEAVKLKKKPLKIAALVIGISLIIFTVIYFLIPLVSNEQKTNGQSGIDPVNQPSPGYGVVADNDQAVAIGMQILEQGGSAVDAAIAVSYALGVVSPFASGIGGGGVMLVYPGDGTAPSAYDYMGTAPEDTSGTIAVPGFVKGMAAAHQDYGQLSMEQLLDPSIKLAQDGITVTPLLNSMLEGSDAKIDSNVRGAFFPDGSAIKSGDVLKQPALAETLAKIKTNGEAAFYTGDVADQIAASNSGITLQDLASYQVEKRTPSIGSYAGYDVYSAAPPSGGVTLIQTLALSEKLELNKYPVNSADYITLLAKITQVTYHDRYANVNDPDFYEVNVNQLTSADYIAQLAAEVTGNNDLNQLVINDSTTDSTGEENTTHIVIYDQTGMMVSVTNTLTYWFGDGTSVGGFFLNSHMANFSTTSASSNRPEAGKRPRSYISPTILAKNDKPVIGIGSPGGKRIPLMITQVLERGLKNNVPWQEAVDATRFYNDQNLIYLEDNYLTTAEEDQLRANGYSVIRYPNPLFYGGVNTLYVDYENKEIVGGADFRRDASWKWTAN